MLLRRAARRTVKPAANDFDINQEIAVLIDHAGGVPLAQRRWVMACILLGMVLSSLDSSIANIALPVIAGSLASSDAATVYVVNGYQLAATICLLPVAALGEALGLKRVYATGLVIFTLSSLTCALSPTLTVLVCSRVFQGAGGACMSVAGMALVRSVYPRSIVSRGLALIALAVAIAAALGPTIAALILAVASWHWLFLVNVPLGLVAIPVFLMRAPAGEAHARRFDWTGALLNALALGLIVTGVGSLGVKGVDIAGAEIVVGAVFFGLLVWQQTTPHITAAASRPAAHSSLCIISRHLDVRLRCANPGLCQSAVLLREESCIFRRWQPVCC